MQEVHVNDTPIPSLPRCFVWIKNVPVVLAKWQIAKYCDIEERESLSQYQKVSIFFLVTVAGAQMEVK